MNVRRVYQARMTTSSDMLLTGMTADEYLIQGTKQRLQKASPNTDTNSLAVAPLFLLQ
jgi:hypothetical protein